MNAINKSAKIFEKIFWIFLFINPMLDIFNGMYIMLVRNIGVLDVEYIDTLGVTPSLLVRMVMLVFFALYILMIRDKKSILTAIPIGLAWLMSMLSELKSLGSVQFFLDTQYLARFCFNIVVLMVYTHVFSVRWGEDGEKLKNNIEAIFGYTLAILGIFIILPSIFGLGYSTYADRLGYRGSRGFFYAGNDITAILTLLSPLCLAKAIKSDPIRNWKSLLLFSLALAFGINAMLIIGSKTAFLACGATAAIMLLAAIFFAIKDRNPFYIINYFIAVIFTALIFLLLNIFTGSAMASAVGTSLEATGTLAQNEGANSAMLNGRDNKLAQQFAMFSSGGVLVWLFGLGRGALEYTLEMDVFEVLFYYGIFGFCAMMWLYAKLAIQFFIGFFKNFSLTAIALLTSIGLCAGYLFIAGHVLFSVTSGFYFALTIVYSRVVFARQSGDILLWRSKA